MLFEPYVRFNIFILVAAYREIAAHSAYDIFSEYKCLIVYLVSPSSVFGVEISF